MTNKAFLDDANIEAVDIDAVNRMLRVRLRRYESPDSRQRIPSTVEFRNIQSFSGVLDLMALASHAWAGNVEDWDPSTGFGLSYLYFARGAFSIYSDEPVVVDGSDQSAETAQVASLSD